MVINRQTYDMLEWLGDMGGLFDALRIIGSFFVVPVSAHALESKLMTTIFRYRKSMEKKPTTGTSSQKVASIRKSWKTFESDGEEGDKDLAKMVKHDFVSIE